MSEFNEEQYLAKERSIFLDSFDVSAKMPSTLSILRHNYDMYNEAYGNVCTYRLLDGFFAVSINMANKTVADFNLPNMYWTLNYFIFSDTELSSNDVIGYKKEGIVCKVSGGLSIIPEAIRPDTLEYVNNASDKEEVVELPINFSNMLSLAEKKVNNKFLYYGQALFTNPILLNVYGSVVDYAQPYGGNVQYDRMTKYVKEQLLAFLPEGSVLDNFSLAKDSRTDNYYTSCITRLEHTPFPVFCYSNDDEWYSAVGNIADGNWDKPYTINNAYVNWTLYVNGLQNCDYTLKIDKHNLKNKICKMRVISHNALLRILSGGGSSHSPTGYTPSIGSVKHNTDTIDYINFSKYDHIDVTNDDKYYKFSFSWLESELPNEIFNEDKDGFLVLCTFGDTDNIDYNKNEYPVGFFSIKRVVNKLSLPLNFIDSTFLGAWDSKLSDVSKNKYTYAMGFYEPYGYDINKDVSYAENSTIKIVFGSDGTDDNPDLADDDDTPKDDIIENDDVTNTLTTASGTLTTTYKIDEYVTRQIGGFLWRNDIASRFELYLNNPIENLLSIKMIPIDAPANNQEPIVIGNVDLETIGGREVTSTNVMVNIGTVDMTHLNKYGNFIDLPPYTKYVIYLPYIGFREFDGSCCLNKSLNVRYSIDLVTGACLAMLYVSDKFKVAEYEGNIGIDIPISASNRGNTESAIISGLADAAISLNPVNIPSAIANSVFAQYSYQSKGAPSPTCLAAANRTCYILIDRPQYTPIKSFAHTKGLYCNKTKYIDNCKGFTICDSNIDLTNIPLTSSEIDELRQILSSGFYA